MILVVPSLDHHADVLHVPERTDRPGAPSPFNNACLIMLGVFPLIVMFLITSITMQRERVSGTLERILTTPLRRLDLLAAYGTAFSIAAAAQATLACVVSFWFLGLDTAGSPSGSSSSRSSTRCWASDSDCSVVRSPAPSFRRCSSCLGDRPQLLLCGIIVPREVMPDWLQWISNVLPASYALEALSRSVHTRSRPRSPCATSPSSSASRWSRCAWPRRHYDEGRHNVDDQHGTQTSRAAARAVGHPRADPGQRAEICSPATGLTRPRSVRSPRTRGSTLRWCTTTSAPRPSSSPRRYTFRSTHGGDRPAAEGAGRARSATCCRRSCCRSGTPNWARDSSRRCARSWRATKSSLIRSFLQEVIAAEVGTRVDDPPGSGRIRVQFVASQLVGVVMARYILELEPFKSLPVEQIAETIAPNLQRYLTGELPGLHLTRGRAAADVRRRR